MITRVIAQTEPSDLTKSSFHVQFASALINVTKVKLLSAVIPNTNQNIELNYTDQFALRIGAETEILTVPHGNYDILELFAIIQQLANLRWPSANFTFEYNRNRFFVTLGASLEFTILPVRRNCMHLLGFVDLPSPVSTMAVANSAVRLNSNRWLTLTLSQPCLSVLQIPSINATSSFLIPTYASPTEISYVNYNDLGPQDISIKPGIDLSSFELSLRRIDSHRDFHLTSDTSFLLEFEHDS